MFLVLAERIGIPWDKLRGSVQNDITLEEVVRSGPDIFLLKTASEFSVIILSLSERMYLYGTLAHLMVTI